MLDFSLSCSHYVSRWYSSLFACSSREERREERAGSGKDERGEPRMNKKVLQELSLHLIVSLRQKPLSTHIGALRARAHFL